jgi:carboxymethylenebutenolidase
MAEHSGNKYDLSALWDKHCEFEFVLRDAAGAMSTMVAEPYVNHIPTMTGGVGHKALYEFYSQHFIPKLPTDIKTITISRTIGESRLVDELIFCCTHDRVIDFLLPNVQPTYKYFEVPTISIVTFEGDKIANEHVYWDQATVLVQIGLMERNCLPVVGLESARKLLDKKLPSNELIGRAG